ncbi:hypothetical protein HMPREF0168_1859 [Bifidobacterium dentium ATCC 27679]|uniref:Uncharacterized protein n=1 Tax=Bifidobacterium dentium ATCC 27679 TaxID=871562 RepID=E0Q9B3_9BIFI|nr:hypothetical protein HMPREF0168_1859 [Bifidobacterium dentium ATCC 27679]
MTNKQRFRAHLLTYLLTTNLGWPEYVEAAYGVTQSCRTGDERLQILFDRYAEMAEQE